MSSEQVADIFRRAAVADLWRSVAADPDVRAHFGNLNIERTSEMAKDKLNRFMDQRNQIAHRGPNYQTVGDTVVLDYIAYFRCIVPALAEVLERQVAQYP
jgi:hypothetical protein